MRVDDTRSSAREQMMALWRHALSSNAQIEFIAGLSPQQHAVQPAPDNDAGAPQSVAGKKRQDRIGMGELLDLLAQQDASTLAHRQQWASLNVDVAIDEAQGLLDDAARLSRKITASLPQLPSNSLVTIRISFDQMQARDAQRVTQKSRSGQSGTRGLLHTVPGLHAYKQVEGLGPQKGVPFRPAGEHTEPPRHISVVFD